jgi:hypothetical protein
MPRRTTKETNILHTKNVFSMCKYALAWDAATFIAIVWSLVALLILGDHAQGYCFLGAALILLGLSVPATLAALARIVEYERLLNAIELTGASSILNIKLQKFFSKFSATKARRNVLVCGFRMLENPPDQIGSLVELSYNDAFKEYKLAAILSKDWFKATFFPVDLSS